MFIKLTDLRCCLDKAAEMATHYETYILDGKNVQRSIEDTVWICQEYLNLKIEQNELPIPAARSSIRALYLAYDDHYEIYLLEGMNYCWNRFVLCKELFHVLLDTEEYRNTKIYQHLEEMGLKAPEPGQEPKSPAVSELMAEIAAMEFMFPYKDRVTIRKNGEVDYAQVAERFKIPQYYVEKYLADGWMDYLGAIAPKT